MPVNWRRGQCNRRESKPCDTLAAHNRRMWKVRAESGHNLLKLPGNVSTLLHPCAEVKKQSVSAFQLTYISGPQLTLTLTPPSLLPPPSPAHSHRTPTSIPKHTCHHQHLLQPPPPPLSFIMLICTFLCFVSPNNYLLMVVLFLLFPLLYVFVRLVIVL